ncbi:MAG: HAD family hydrolase [Elusimicrobia bacterium]|nr:HAD family hydrolase [Elusimicrobiota bacterium]
MIAYLRKNRDKAKRPAVFLDRDGTLIHDRPGFYLTDPAKLRFYRYTFKALKLLSGLGYRLIVITNQSGVGRGYLTLGASAAINRRMQANLAQNGALLDGIYFCPHGPDEGCACRKPAPGLVKEAAKHHRLDLGRSYLIGDKLSDMRLAGALKLRRVFLKSGHGRSQLKKYPGPLKKQVIKNDLLAAARWIEERQVKVKMKVKNRKSRRR